MEYDPKDLEMVARALAIEYPNQVITMGDVMAEARRLHLCKPIGA